jgi:micrococcal nuclease
VRGPTAPPTTDEQAAPGKAERPGEEGGPAVTVARVVDGDTVEIIPAVDGLTEVRLIGVYTPETKDPRTGVQPYGEEAYRFTASTLEGEEVSLEFDVEKVDRYGRLLAYVWLPDGRMFNEVLLKEGYAPVATFPPNVRYVERFEKAQREAREAGRGLWGLPEGQLCQQTDRGNGIGPGRR